MKRSDQILIRWRIRNKCKKLRWNYVKTKSSKQFATWSFQSIYDLVFHYSNLLDRDSTDPLLYHWHLRIIVHLHIYIHFDCTYISLRISSRSSLIIKIDNEIRFSTKFFLLNSYNLLQYTYNEIFNFENSLCANVRKINTFLNI